jgi:methionyl-tRNA formyltransferase
VRILFAGTPAIAVPALEAVARSFDLAAVLTNPDAPAGRGGRLAASPVKQACLSLGLEVLEPARLDAPLVDRVRRLEPELLVVAAYGRIFRPEFLSLFPRGAVNLHPSLLPRHRGPAPIAATILAGDVEGGVTIQRVAAAVDTGAILAQERVPLDGTETAGSLAERLAPLGAELLVRVLEDIEYGRATEREQEHERATYCRKLTKADGLIDWREDALTISRKVRAFDPVPGAYTRCGGRLLNLLDAFPAPAECPPSMAGLGSGPSMAPGVVLRADKRYGILVSTGQGLLCVRRLQLEARKALEWRAFCNGVPGFVGSRLGESDHATTVDAAKSHD